MAVQFNLLPDIKLEFNRQQHAKKVVYSLSTLAIVIVMALFVLSFLVVNVLQKKLLDDANKDITTYSNQLKSIPDLEKVLTIQNQLKSLPAKHQQKRISSRLFTYLPEVTPTHVQIGKLTMNTTANTMLISGTADSVQLVNKFIDTLKFTSYTVGEDTTKKIPAFSNVILTKVDRNDKEASYTLSVTYDPALFDATKTVTLQVPEETTTRSFINSPNANEQLFNGQTAPPESSNQEGGQ